MRPSGIAASLLFLLLGCSAAPGALPWKVTTSDDEIVTRAQAFEAEIRRGACDGPILHREVFTDEATTPPVLAPGQYAFVVRARDVDCRVVGAGCAQVTLPTSSECIEVELVAAAGDSCPGGATCMSGLCVSPDAAIRDSSTADSTARDSTIVDSDVPDSGVADTRPLDSARPDVGCATDVDCDDDSPCTTDQCVAGTCMNAPTSGSCDDGIFCNGTDTCSGGRCAHSGSPCGGTCSATEDVCRSDCSSAWRMMSGCVGGTVISEMAIPTGVACTAYCEDVSVSLRMAVDCCQHDTLGACRAFSGSSGTAVAAGALAKVCVY